MSKPDGELELTPEEEIKAQPSIGQLRNICQKHGVDFYKHHDFIADVRTAYLKGYKQAVQAKLAKATPIIKAQVAREIFGELEKHKKVTETELYIGRATYTHYDLSKNVVDNLKSHYLQEVKENE